MDRARLACQPAVGIDASRVSFGSEPVSDAVLPGIFPEQQGKARRKRSLFGLAMRGVEARQRLGTGAEFGLAERVERGLDRVEEFV